MSVLAELLAAGYPAALAAGMAVNFAIAGIALAGGLVVGLPLAAAQQAGGAIRRGTGPLLGLMRAAPTFVVMFFLLNTIPRDLTLMGFSLAPSGPDIVALSLVPYAAAYAADNGADAFDRWRAGSPEAALLFVPNLVRAYFVLVMSSSAGAAIGVNEGVAAVLRAADRWPSLGDKLVVFATGILAFGVVFQLGFAAVRLAVARMERRHRAKGAPND
ncbi:MAG: hypothetical protein ACFBRM_13655 [Pikeienuella sp.]